MTTDHHRPPQTKRFKPQMTADQMLRPKKTTDHHRPDVLGLKWPQTKYYRPQMTTDHHRPNVLSLKWPQTKCYRP